MATLAVNGTQIPWHAPADACDTWQDLLSAECVAKYLSGSSNVRILCPEVKKLQGFFSEREITVGYDKKPTILEGQFQYARAFERCGKLVCNLATQSIYQVGNYDRAYAPQDKIPELAVVSGMVKIDDVAAHTKMSIFVKTMTGKTITIMSHTELQVKELKSLVQSKNGMPPDQQRLIFKHMQLEDNRTIGDYGIVPNSTLHLVTRLRGGMMHITSSRSDFLSMGGVFEPTMVDVDVIGNGTFNVTISGEDTDQDVILRLFKMCAESRQQEVSCRKRKHHQA